MGLSTMERMLESLKNGEEFLNPLPRRPLSKARLPSRFSSATFQKIIPSHESETFQKSFSDLEDDDIEQHRNLSSLRTAPRYYIVWTFCLLLLFIVAIVILCAVFQPRIPKYSLDRIQITDFSVSSQFVVGLRAKNPNKKIDIYYLDNSYLAIFYSATELSKGKIPAFYEGHKNTSNLDITLSGCNVQITSEKVSSLNAQEKEGSIPLRLKVKFGKQDYFPRGLRSGGRQTGCKKCKVKL